MREDMDKVIVERPRWGSRNQSRKKGYRKYVQQTSAENLPTREPMLGSWGGKERYHSDHLEPLRRFLRSHVGRPWNKVHQEICAQVSLNNAVQKHVLTHVFNDVTIHVEIRDGKVYAADGWFFHHQLPPGTLYVCPRTGLLKQVPQNRRNRQAANPRQLYRGQLLQYRQIGQQWWELRLLERPTDAAKRWDVWLERPLAAITDDQLRDTFGGLLTAVSRHPLSPREMRELYRLLRKQKQARVVKQTRRSARIFPQR